MNDGDPPPYGNRLLGRHPRLLVATNMLLLVIVTINLLVTSEAPVVLYQAF